MKNNNAIKSNTKFKIAVIVPAFNEELSIASVIDDLTKETDNFQIVIVNDGSKDNTSAVARSSGKAIVIDLPLNLGIGGAVQTGFIFAARGDYDIAIQFDGDGQHNAREIRDLIAPVINGVCDVSIGSRFCEKRHGFKSTLMRRVGIKVFQVVTSLIIHQRITDNTSGFRAYNRAAIRFLADDYPVDYPEPEAVILLGKAGFRIKEVYAEMKERQGGVSSISGLSSLYYMLKVLFGMFMTALRTTKKRGL